MEITVTQALEEKKLLIKRIFHLTEQAEFVECAAGIESNSVGSCVETARCKKQAEAFWQEILTSVEQYQRLEMAILASDAATRIETSFGEFSVAAALSLVRRLNGYDFDGVELEFEENLFRKVRREYREKRKKTEVSGGLFLDPLNIMGRANQLLEKKNRLLAELTTQIRLSNAKTWIEIEGEVKHVSAD